MLLALLRAIGDALRRPIPRLRRVCSRSQVSFHQTPVMLDHDGRWSVYRPPVLTRLALKIDRDRRVAAGHEHVVGQPFDLPTLWAGDRIRCVRALLLEH
jgi:hypothetical protein